MPEEKGVYSHNLDRGVLNEDSDVREKGTGEELDEVRERDSQPGGGMGRGETPREDPGQGRYERPNDPDRDEDQQVNTTEGTEETPMPTRHAPGSDEEPS